MVARYMTKKLRRQDNYDDQEESNGKELYVSPSLQEQDGEVETERSRCRSTAEGRVLSFPQSLTISPVMLV